MTYGFQHAGKYVGYDGESAADGYQFTTASKALTFPTRGLIDKFATETGPAWLLDMFRKGLVTIVEMP